MLKEMISSLLGELIPKDFFLNFLLNKIHRSDKDLLTDEQVENLELNEDFTNIFIGSAAASQSKF